MTTEARNDLASIFVPLGKDVTRYARDVVAGKIIAGKLVVKACARHLRDIEHAHERGLEFSEFTAGRAIYFFRNLKHYKGEWAGQELELELWQKFIIGSLFGWLHTVSKLRRYRTAYVEIPRKNGKSLIAAGVGLYLAFYDDEGGAEVYAAATKRDQAKIVWGDARTMTLASPRLKRKINVLVGNLHSPESSSKFEPLGADVDGMDGLNVHGAIIDELHAHKTRVLWDVIQTATGARRQPLTFAITTAGFGKHSICREQHDYGESVLSEVFEDDTFFAYIASIDEGDDWRDPSSWQKANPNYGISVKVDDLERKAFTAQQAPAAQNEFLRKHLNVWTEQETRWLDMAVWSENEAEVDAESLKGKDCYAGLDLSLTTDITALELYFPSGTGGGDWLHYYFVPEEGINGRSRRDRVPYDVWESQGYIIATEGNVVDYDHIRQKLNDLVSEGYNIKQVGIDPWNATQLAGQLMSDGFNVVEVRQGFASMTAPTKELERLLLSRKMRIDRNPVTRWAASNVSVQSDAAGNLKPAKPDGNRPQRIDPIVAMIMAVSGAMRHEADENTWHGIYVPGMNT